jgi:IS605 OrfB family transposase
MKTYRNNLLIQNSYVEGVAALYSSTYGVINDKQNRESEIVPTPWYRFCRDLLLPSRFLFIYMKFIRSTKCSLEFSTAHKKQQLQTVLTEYGRVCNIFIEYFWKNGAPSKSELLKPVIDIPQDTWLSARLRKVAAREAIDLIIATRERWKSKPNKLVMPVHKGHRAYVSCTIADLQDSKDSSFDAWLHLQSIGNDIITNEYVQFAYEIETVPKRTGNQAVGVDTGINALASTNTGHQFGLDIKVLIERIKRCEHGSNGQKTARRALKQRMDEVAKEILHHFKDVDLVVVEALKNLNYKTKLKRRLSRNIRRSIGTWAYRYWLHRLEMACEMNRVHFKTVAPAYTSQRCPSCGHTDRGNRQGTVFKCLGCGHTDNADVVGSLNILWRFLTGPYGAGYEPCRAMS